MKTSSPLGSCERMYRGAVRVMASAAAVLPWAAHGQFGPPSSSAGLPTGSLESMLSGVIGTFLLLVGILAVGFIVYGGFRYLSARGDERELEAAKNTIAQAVVAVVIIGLAYALVQFAFRTVGSGGAIPPS